MSTSKILTLIGVICFILAAVGVSFGVALLPIGLAFCFAAKLV